MGIIVFVGLVALIVWGLNYIVNKDNSTTKEPIVVTSNDTNQVPTEQAVDNSVSTTTFATTTTATSTQITVTPTQTSVASSTISDSSNPTVHFTDTGFSPSTLTVLKGQTVTFSNDSSDTMRVASNPFPSSSDYPAFVEKTGADSGSTWSFTFTKTGVWFYHNHYHPAQGGKIIVNAN